MANDLKDYWTRRMAEQGKAVDGTPLPATQQPAQASQTATSPQADTAPASNNPLYNYWSKRMAEQGKTAEGSPLTSNLNAAPVAEANTTPSDISTIRNWYTGVNTDLTTINNYASSGQYDADLNQEYLTKLRNYNTELDGYIDSASSQGYNKDANTMQNTKNGVDALIKQLEESANSQTRTIDTSIQKTLGSAADYSQQVSDLESQIKELERTNHRGVIRQDTDAVSGELYDVYGNVNDEALHQLREQLQNANANKAAAERSEQRERLRNNPNFEQYSSSITPITENDAAIRALGGKSIDAVSGETVTDQSVKDLLGYATKDEEQLFNYILARQGEDAAAEYLDDLRYDLNARQASEKSQEASQYADEHGVLASGKSVGQNLISGAGWFDTAIQNAYRDITGENRRIDYNTWANQQSQQVQATRQTVAEDLVENHPNFKFDLLGREVNLGDVYQLGMSMLDSGATAALGAATGGGGWTAGLLGASAGSQTTQEAVRNGASDSEALRLGFAAMVAETATEKFSIDGLLEGTGKTWFTNLLKQAGVEASEEAASTVLNTIADDAIRGENSDYNRRIRELEQSGMSHEDASDQAWKELGQQIMFDAIGGAVSGGIMGGMFRGVRSNTDTQTQQNTETTTEQTEQTASTPLAETVNRANQQATEETAQTAPQNSPTEQTSVSETNTPLSETVLNATEAQQNASAPTVSENTENPQGPRPFDMGQVARDVWSQQTQQAQEQNATNATDQAQTEQTEANPAAAEVNTESQNADVTGEAQTESQAWRPDGQGEDVREHSTSERIRERKTVVHDALVEETQADPSYYKVRHNKDTVAAAEAVLFNEDGSEADLNEVASHAETKLSNARNGTGKIKPEDVLISVQAADRLMEHANTLEQSGLTQEAQSERARADRIMSALYAEQAEAGQLSQAARLISKASPATQRQMRQDYLERCLNDWNNKLTKAQGRKIQAQTGENTIQLPTELTEAYVNAETDADLQKAYSDIVSYVGQNTPSTLYQQITALRFLNMLGNPVTQGRNIIGNTFSFANYFVKRRMQSVLESLFTPDDKTFALGIDLNDLRAWMGLTSDPEIAAALENNGRYQDVRSQNRSKFAQDSIDEQTVFGNKALEGYRKLTNKATSGGDIIFLKLNFADAAQAYARAHGFTLETATPEQKAAAVAVATKEAQEATFHDDTAISELATKARVDENGEWANRNRVNKATAKIVNALGDGLQPFRKTPANVAVRGEEFSPLGFINALIKSGVRFHDIMTKGSSEITTSDVINQLSKALTGTGLTIAGAMLRAAGKARTSDDEDKNLNTYEKMNGLQDYAIKINGKWTTADWAAPDSIPFFMGVELYDALNGSGQFNEDDIINVFGALTGTMTEMSMLQGINDTLKGLNSFGGDDNALMKFVTALGTSYLQQLLGNSFLGRIESAATPYRQSTYIDPDSGLSSETQYALGRLSNKIPFWDYQQEDYIDAWGNKVENQNTSNPLTRAVRSIGSPAYISEEKTTELDQALYDLNAELKELGIETNVFPSRAKRSVDNVQLTPKEYERFATEQGQLKHDLVEEFTNSPYWGAMTAEEKANTIRELYSYAEDRATQNIRASRGTIEVGKSDNDKIAVALDNNAEDIAGYLALKDSFSDRKSTGDYAGIDSLLATVNTAKNEDGTYADPEVQQMISDSDFSRYLSAYAGGTSAELVGSVLDNIEAADSLLPDDDSADQGEKIRIVFETLSREGADVQDYKNILDTYKKANVSQAKVNWLVKNFFPDDVETQRELYNVFRDYQLTQGKWKTPFEKQKDATEPENLMP